MSLEKIVRPFTSADISPPKSSIASRSINAYGYVTLAIGEKGSVKKVTLTATASASVYAVKKPTEKAL